MEAEFITSVKDPSKFPDLDLPEVAFVGRSNSGKSSCINGLTCRKSLARSSSVPGRTRLINLFRVADANNAIMLVDLPGFGYSEAGKSTTRQWQQMCQGYLSRPNIVVVLLEDVRRKPDPILADLLATLGSNSRCVMAFTKIDKVKKSQRKKLFAERSKTVAEWGVEQSFFISVMEKPSLDSLRDYILAPSSS